MTTPISLDKVRHLRYSANDIADIEELMGEGFVSLISSTNIVGVRHARAFLWGGLKHEDRRLLGKRGVESAGDLIKVWYDNGGNLETLYVKMFEALKNDGWLEPLSKEDIEKLEDDMGEVMGLNTEAEG
jgi:hypothetical protein